MLVNRLANGMRAVPSVKRLRLNLSEIMLMGIDILDMLFAVVSFELGKTETFQIEALGGGDGAVTIIYRKSDSRSWRRRCRKAKWTAQPFSRTRGFWSCIMSAARPRGGTTCTALFSM